MNEQISKHSWITHTRISRTSFWLLQIVNFTVFVAVVIWAFTVFPFNVSFWINVVISILILETGIVLAILRSNDVSPELLKNKLGSSIIVGSSLPLSLLDFYLVSQGYGILWFAPSDENADGTLYQYQKKYFYTFMALAHPLLSS